MAVLFFDPLALGLLVALLAYVWAVWRGHFRRWFGRPEPWTVIAWPGPLLVIVAPMVAGGLLWSLRLAGLEIGDGHVSDAALYAAAYLAPAVGFAVWPPRWLLPGWSRDRLARFPTAAGAGVPAEAMPAVQATRGHGSRARWIWWVDGIPGHVWLDGSQLRFRAEAPSVASSAIDLDDDALAQLRFSVEGDLRLEPPRGGLWGRGQLDVELTEVDQVRHHALVPWRRDGLIELEVDGRGSVRVWVADARSLEARLLSARRGA